MLLFTIFHVIYFSEEKLDESLVTKPSTRSRVVVLADGTYAHQAAAELIADKKVGAGIFLSSYFICFYIFYPCFYFC